MAIRKALMTTQPGWADVRIDDAGFRDRFQKLPHIIESWVSRYLSLRGSKVLDFGCGEGVTALGMTLLHEPAELIGVDIMPDPARCPELAKRHLNLDALPAAMHLHQIDADELPESARDLDLIYAWSVFEHVDQTILSQVLANLHSRLKRGGLLFVQIAPLYYSSEGSHLCHKVPEPWGHLTIQTNRYEARLRDVCESDAEYDSLWSTFRTLNRITAQQLEHEISKVRFEIVRRFATTENLKPPAALSGIYDEKVLRTNQVVILARK